MLWFPLQGMWGQAQYDAPAQFAHDAYQLGPHQPPAAYPYQAMSEEQLWEVARQRAEINLVTRPHVTSECQQKRNSRQ